MHILLIIKSDTSADVCQTDLSNKIGHLLDRFTLDSNKKKHSVVRYNMFCCLILKLCSSISITICGQ